jgi:hypothetical protein
MISNVLRDLPFSRNKPLKSTDDLEFWKINGINKTRRLDPVTESRNM